VSPQAQAVDYANIDVIDGAAPTNTTPPTATIPAGQNTTSGASTEGFFVDSGSVVGEVPIRIGGSAANDAAGGILVVTPRETLRNPPEGPTAGLAASVSTVADDDSTSQNTRNVSGGLAIVTDRAGSNNPTTAYPVGGPMNVNVAAAYFSFNQGWLGGVASASAINGPIDSFFGSPGITFSPTIGSANTAHVRPNYFFTPPYDISDQTKNGHHFVSIPGVTDSRQQGMLFAMHAKNEDNFAAVSATTDGSGWHVNTRGNALDSANNGESDPFSFVFLPLGTPNVTMGVMWGAAGQFGEPTPVLKSGGNFSLTRAAGATGNFRLTIDGQTPTSGVLLVGTESNQGGTGGLPGDNLVTYRPDGDGWIIVSDDLPTMNPTAGQNGQSSEPIPYFHFAFLPFNAPPGAPTIPASAWTRSDVFAYRLALTEIDGRDNDNDDFTATPDPLTGVVPGPGVYATVAGSTPGINVIPTNMNRGDSRSTINGAYPTPTDGVMFATISEGLRDNSTTHGINEYGVITVAPTGDQWKFTPSGADPSTGEANINYAVAFFGANSGFQMGVNAPHDSTGLGSVSISGVNSLTDGVLMANASGPVVANTASEDNFVVVNPKSDGSGWDVQNLDNGLAPQDFGFNYVYLPYTSQNLVAGRVNSDGTLASSTSTSGFSLVKEAAGSYLLTVNGKTPSSGMLLLTGGNGDASSADNTIVYESAGNAFRILGVDLITQAEKEAGNFTMLEDSGFQFAYIDYIDAPIAPATGFLAADFNNSGTVDSADLAAWKSGFGTASGAAKANGDANGDGAVNGSDFLVWQRQLNGASSLASQQNVPEPSSALLTLALVGCLGRWRHATKTRNQRTENASFQGS
jgi:hypothetical protein